MKIKKVCLATALLVLAACAGSPKIKPVETTGQVSVLETRSVRDEATGVFQEQMVKHMETAERSVVDKGAEALLSTQRVVTLGPYFSSYDVGPGNVIVLSQPNRNAGEDLWLFAAGKTRLTKTTYPHHAPSLSSDGKRVYFASTRGKVNRDSFDQNSYIWRIASQGGSGITRIGTPTFQMSDPLESSDGSKILFVAQEYHDSSPFIWFMQDNGALPTQLHAGVDARWMDDQHIVFAARDESTGRYAIWTSRTDGSMLTQLVADEDMDCLQPVAVDGGAYIAYVKQKPGQPQSRDIYLYSQASGLSQQLTTNASRDDLPRWGDKGKYLFFRSSRGLNWNVWRVSTKFLKDGA